MKAYQIFPTCPSSSIKKCPLHYICERIPIVISGSVPHLEYTKICDHPFNYTLHPKPCTLNPKPSTSNLKP